MPVDIAHGDVVIGLSSTGRARWESEDNAGIGSNGLTGARHELLARYYGEVYPESHAPEIDTTFVYSGPHKLEDPLPGSDMTIGKAPARRRAPMCHLSAISLKPLAVKTSMA